MQKFTQKYTIIQLFEDRSEGYEYPMTNWPIHSTVVDTFAIDWDIATLCSKLSKHLKTVSGANTVVESDEFFGENGQIRVALLEKTESLVKLHYSLIELLSGGGLVLNNPEYSKEGFLPHSTVQPHGRVNKGEHLEFNKLSIIDMFPEQDATQRKIIKTFPIGQ